MTRTVIKLRKPPQEAIGNPEAPKQKIVKSNVDPPLDWSVNKHD